MTKNLEIMPKSEKKLKRHLAGVKQQLRSAVSGKHKDVKLVKKLKEEITWINAQQTINHNKLNGWNGAHHFRVKRPWWPWDTSGFLA